jgi:hypothetical protein
MAAFQSQQIAVADTPTPIVSGLSGRYQIVIKSGGETTVGDSSVAWTTGPYLSGSIGDALLVLDVLLDSTDVLYAIAPPGDNSSVSVMVSPR